MGRKGNQFMFSYIRRPFGLLALAALWVIPAMAGPVTISMGGTWGALSGSDAYFASSEPWTLSFQVANPPAVIVSDSATFLTFYSNAVYTLNGSPVAVTGNVVKFSTTQGTPGISVCLGVNNNCQFQLATSNGSQALFTGAPSSPTMVPGLYLTSSSGFQAIDLTINPNNPLGTTPGIQTISVTSQDSAVPEPATWALTGAGVLLAGLYRRRHKGTEFNADLAGQMAPRL